MTKDLNPISIIHREGDGYASSNGGGSSCVTGEGDGFCMEDPADFPLGPACDLSKEGGCDACQ